jgi:hypothetical protein
MRDIIAAVLTGSTATIGAVFVPPTARAVMLILWIVTLYLLHKAGAPVTTPDTTGAHTGRQRRQPASLQPGNVRHQTHNAGPKRISRCL